MPSFRSRRVVLPDGLRAATVHHEGGVVVDIGQGAADEDFGELVVMPGLVDSHVHVNEPGRESWEGFRTATRAAAAGGTTTIVDMPLNSIPPTVDPEALAAKRTAAAGGIAVDVAFWGGLIPGSEPWVESLVGAGVCGFKSFLVDSGVPEFPPMTLSGLEAVLPELARLGVPLLLHAEDPIRLHQMSGDTRSYRTYLESRPPESEGEAVGQAVGLSARTGGQIHVLHVSSADATDMLRGAGPELSAETCPHYLTFSAEEIGSGATEFKCAPPIRARVHREALWEALADGTLVMIVSDHSPAPPELKAAESGDFSTAWGGISSLQIRLQVIWTEASRRGFGFERLVEWLSTAPARLAGLDRKGSIENGKDADFLVWDPDGVTQVVGSGLEHRHSLTPYEGMRLRGKVEKVTLGGQTLYEADTGVLGCGGRMLERGWST
ncbi:MAG TPA: allantoinase AllB [Acidimicrobiia bacterium]|nr:allantoinase AllB [Acidimicrobiia bacterium]